MTADFTSPHLEKRLNDIGLGKHEYKGALSTLCQGCGHNSISNQIISVCYELNINPQRIMKFSGIGCSSKSLAYFLARSFGFNGLHGRMPSLAQGAMFADVTLRSIGISGDGDTASIGLGQFKHIIRRNAPLVLVIENNGVYGLTKGQFAPTAEKGLTLKRQGTNHYFPVDICMEALASNASFVARSFAGDPHQVKELLKAAFRHNGIAVIDIISPCVTFHNREDSVHSYTGGKAHDLPLHEVSFIPARDEIRIKDFKNGDIQEVYLHDGGVIRLKKLGKDYDPCDRYKAFVVLDDAEKNNLLVTGLLFIDPERKTMIENFSLPETPLNRLNELRLRPSRDMLEKINQTMS